MGARDRGRKSFGRTVCWHRSVSASRCNSLRRGILNPSFLLAASLMGTIIASRQTDLITLPVFCAVITRLVKLATRFSTCKTKNQLIGALELIDEILRPPSLPPPSPVSSPCEAARSVQDL